MIDPLLVWIALACVATLLAHAAVGKLMDRALFEQHLAAYGVPHALLAAAAVALPAIELIAALLLFTPWRAAAAALAVALFVLYVAAMAQALLRGRRLDCGCGGEPLAVSWTLVARNVVLVGVALTAGATMAPRPMGVGDFLVVAASLLLATLLYAALHQVLRHRAGVIAHKRTHTHFRRI
jgi:hypothetical protein